MAIRVPLGIVTMQARCDWLAGAKASERAALRKQVTAHAGKCFDEAWKEAVKQWEKIRK